MPVRSLSSSVLKWPDAHSVDEVVRLWTQRALNRRDDVLRIGYFGSYARGDWGVGSDLDVTIILENSQQPFEKRSMAWDTLELPVPTDVLVYTQEEWQSLSPQRRFHQTLRRETVWVYVKDQA
jgi:predicted nucleotidyltransferase